MNYDGDLVEFVLFFLHAQSTEQENGSQTKHKLEAQMWCCSTLNEVHFGDNCRPQKQWTARNVRAVPLRDTTI